MSAHKSRHASVTTVEIPTEPPRCIYWLEFGQSRQVQSLSICDGQSYTVGSRASCDLVLRDPTVSAQHCRIYCESGRLQLQDLGSRNGLYVGGARVPGAELREGSTFVLGQVSVAVHQLPLDPAPSVPVAPLPGLIGKSGAMLRLSEQVRRLAGLSIPVLIQGPTGAGKDLVAKALHQLSPRAKKPYVPLNAGSLPKELASAELFGHDRGAFTGAYTRRDGAFVQAHQGTLFLDEVGELAPEVQVKMLRVLEDGMVRPLGSTSPRQVNVRLVSATWAPLDKLIEQGRFREDLFHRLAVGLLQVPSLSDRRADIGALAEHFLSQHTEELGSKRLSPAALSTLLYQRWPGNVRQLRNTVVRAAIHAPGEFIQPEDIDFALSDQPSGPGRLSTAAAKALMMQCEGKVAVAARLCGVPRSTFRGWLSPRRPQRG